MSEDDIVNEGIARLHAAQAMEELKRRHPNADWRTDVPCPDCGSMEHFECGMLPNN